jgi:large subunit ribosomal protein L6
MSRIGKLQIPIPSGTTLDIGSDGATVSVKGPKGQLSRTLPKVSVELDGAMATVKAGGKSQDHRALHGLSRALLNNMVVGCSVGHKRSLLITGTGYKAELSGQKLKMALGFSHDVLFELPKTVSGKIEDRGMRIELECPDKELLGLVSAKIRGFRPPEPYKGKGVRYSDETIRRKAGKAGK